MLGKVGHFRILAANSCLLNVYLLIHIQLALVGGLFWLTEFVQRNQHWICCWVSVASVCSFVTRDKMSVLWSMVKFALFKDG